jgi:molybdate transport system ATP-binding protein
MIDADLGQSVRVKIRARDISLALKKPTGISQINILSGKIQDIGASRDQDDEITPHEINICVDIGFPLWARITKLSLDQMKLSVGKEVYALIKSTSIDRQSLGKKEPKAI